MQNLQLNKWFLSQKSKSMFKYIYTYTKYIYVHMYMYSFPLKIILNRFHTDTWQYVNEFASATGSWQNMQKYAGIKNDINKWNLQKLSQELMKIADTSALPKIQYEWITVQLSNGIILTGKTKREICTQTHTLLENRTTNKFVI